MWPVLLVSMFALPVTGEDVSLLGRTWSSRDWKAIHRLEKKVREQDEVFSLDEGNWIVQAPSGQLAAELSYHLDQFEDMFFEWVPLTRTIQFKPTFIVYANQADLVKNAKIESGARFLRHHETLPGPPLPDGRRPPPRILWKLYHVFTIQEEHESKGAVLDLPAVHRELARALFQSIVGLPEMDSMHWLGEGVPAFFESADPEVKRKDFLDQRRERSPYLAWLKTAAQPPTLAWLFEHRCRNLSGEERSRAYAYSESFVDLLLAQPSCRKDLEEIVKTIGTKSSSQPRKGPFSRRGMAKLESLWHDHLEEILASH